MNILGGIQKYLLAGAALLIAGMAFALKLLSAQRAAAKAEAVREKVNRKAIEGARKREHAALQAAGKAREEAIRVQQKIDRDRDKGRREQFMDERLQRRRDSSGNGGDW